MSGGAMSVGAVRGAVSAGEWIEVGTIDDLPVRGSRTVELPGRPDIALFRTADDHLFALVDRCPHKQGPLSQGIVHGHSVSCPLHNWTIALATGQAQAPDEGCTPTVRVRLDEGRIWLALPPSIAAAA